MLRLALPCLLVALSPGLGACKPRGLDEPPASDAGAPTEIAETTDIFGASRGLRPAGAMRWSPDGKQVGLGTWVLSSEGERLAATQGRIWGFGAEGPVVFSLGLWDDGQLGQRGTSGAPDQTRLFLGSGLLTQQLDGVAPVALSARGSTLLVESRDELRAWSTFGREPVVLPASYRERSDPTRLSPDGRLFAHLSEPRTVQLLDVTTGHPRTEFVASCDVTLVQFSPDGERLLVGCDGDELLLVAVADPTKSRRLRTPWSRHAIAFSPRGHLLALGHPHTLSVYPVADAAEPLVIKTSEARLLTWSPDERHLAWSGSQANLSVLDLTTHATSSAGPGLLVGFHPARPLVAIQVGDGVQVRSLPDLAMAAVVRGEPLRTDDGAWTDDGLLMTVHDSVWSLWDADTGALRERVPVLAQPLAEGIWSWGRPVATARFVSFAQWRLLPGESVLSEAVRVVIRRRDGKRLFVRVIHVGERDFTVATDDAGRFFCDDEALGGFTVRDARGERPAKDARERLAPGLLAGFFAR